MNKLTTTLFAFFFCIAAFAQTDTDAKYRLTSSSDALSVSALQLLDPYLSPSTYSGLGVGYEHTARRLFDADNNQLSNQTKLSGLVGIALNPAYTAQMTYLATDFSWGMHYHFAPMPNLQILVGGSASADFALKSLSRNVNNPVNIDLATNLNFSAEAAYDIHLRRRSLRLKYSFETPILGCMFAPMGGASYYEMFELGNLDNAIHFSSLHNKQAYDLAFSIDVPFRYLTWQFGVSSSSLSYKANDMVFSTSGFSLEIGLRYDLHVFRGMRNKAPQNFIHPNF